jgi:mannan endo-1,4-beta-mannosidase
MVCIPILIFILLTNADDFVRTDAQKFTIGGKETKMIGTNNYYLIYSSKKMVIDVFEKAKAMNLSSIRIQGYLDGVSANNVTMQPYLGIYDDAGFARLDFVVCTAQSYGIKLVINLVNNWEAFGGVGMYVDWINQKLSTNLSHDDFYSNNFTKIYFMKYIYHMISRNNTCNGYIYKDDPTIMAWQLANEPRAQSDPTGKKILQWAEEISSFIKSIDSNHLVSIGNEGFLCEPSGKSWMYDCSQGTNSELLAKINTIDYVTMHMYPDNWKLNNVETIEYIEKNIALAQAANKPLIIEEFGDKNNKVIKYSEWTDYFEKAGVQGDEFWMLCGNEDNGARYPNYDGYCVYYPSDEALVLEKHAKQNHNSDAITVGTRVGIIVLLLLLL